MFTAIFSVEAGREFAARLVWLAGERRPPGSWRVDRDETMRSAGVSRCASFTSVVVLERRKKPKPGITRGRGKGCVLHSQKKNVQCQLVRRQNVGSQQNNSEAPLQQQDDIIVIIPFRSSQQRGSTTQAETEKRAGWSRQTPAPPHPVPGLIQPTHNTLLGATPLSRTADAARRG